VNIIEDIKKHRRATTIDETPAMARTNTTGVALKRTARGIRVY
jgi:hypothetical protein